jgi:hypothetical protein
MKTGPTLMYQNRNICAGNGQKGKRVPGAGQTAGSERPSVAPIGAGSPDTAVFFEFGRRQLPVALTAIPAHSRKRAGVPKAGPPPNIVSKYIHDKFWIHAHRNSQAAPLPPGMGQLHIKVLI